MLVLLLSFGIGLSFAAPYLERPPTATVVPPASTVPLSSEERKLLHDRIKNEDRERILQLNQHLVDFKTDKVDIDDQILDLARTANVNTLVDAGQLDGNPAGYSSNGPLPLGWVAAQFTAQRSVTWQTYDGKTLLFWKDPDVAFIAQQIVDGHGVKLVCPAPADATMDTLLQDYLSQNNGWDRQSQALTCTVNIYDLPTALRMQIIAKTQEALIIRPDRPLPPHMIWFEDEPWTNARLWLRNGTRPSGKKGQFLWLNLPLLSKGKQIFGEATGAGWLP
jgi:hypothetical protein